MEWYSGSVNVDGQNVDVRGVIEDSVLKITVNGKSKFEKVLNMWAFQEIIPEDVLMKYEGKVRKIESKIPNWIASGKLVL